MCYRFLVAKLLTVCFLVASSKSLLVFYPALLFLYLPSFLKTPSFSYFFSQTNCMRLFPLTLLPLSSVFPSLLLPKEHPFPTYVKIFHSFYSTKENSLSNHP